MLQVVSNRELDALGYYDCIVFPTKGARPHPSEIAGSDLDGDQYFVTWDPELIPMKTVPPYNYDESVAAAVPLKSIGRDIIIDEFVNYDIFIVGKVHKLYCKWANAKGVASKECEELSKLFSKAIDSAKTGEIVKIPNNLKNLPEEKQKTKYIWQVLKKMAKEKIQEYQKRKVENLSCTAFSSRLMINMLLDRSSISVSEYELWKVMHRVINF